MIDSLFDPQKCYVRKPLNYWLYGQLHHLAGGSCVHSHHLNLKKKGGARTCPLYSSESSVFKNEMVMIILVALRAHHDLTLMSCNITPCTGLGLSAY